MTRAVTVAPWARRLPFVVAPVFWLVFVVRSVLVADDTWYYTLFDDGMISMRYAQNLAEGEGLVWNAGEAGVEGYTNFLWTVWMGVLHLTGLPGKVVALLVSASSALLLFGILVVVRRLAGLLHPEDERVALGAVWLTALFYPLAFWSLRGMEVGLVALVLVTTVLLTIDLPDHGTPRRFASLAAIGAVGVLTRTDTAFFLLAIAGVYAWTAPAGRRRAGALVLAGTPLVTLLAHTLLRVRWYGEALPNTYTLKIAGSSIAERLSRGGLTLASVLFAQLLLAAILAVAAVARSEGELRRRVLLVVTPVAVAAAYHLWVGGDAWEWANYSNRFLASAAPLLLIAVASGVAQIASSPDRRPASNLLRGLAVAAVLAAVFVSTDTMRTPVVLGTGFAGELRVALVLGLLLVATVLLLVVRAAGSEAQANRRFFVGCLVVVALSGGLWPFGHWVATRGIEMEADLDTARMGTFLRELVPEGSTGGPGSAGPSVAVTRAGSLVYFSELPAIDLLGKSDPVIAHLPPRKFFPGHSKWNFEHSIRDLRPAIILDLFFPTDDELAAIRSWGYVALSTRVWIDPMQVDEAQMREIVARAGWDQEAPENPTGATGSG